MRRDPQVTRTAHRLFELVTKRHMENENVVRQVGGYRVDRALGLLVGDGLVKVRETYIFGACLVISLTDKGIATLQEKTRVVLALRTS